MIGDTIESAVAAFRDRVRNPLLGAFLISWIAFNFHSILYVLSDLDVHEKVRILTVTYSGGPWYEALAKLVAFPLMSAILATLAFPFISYVFLKPNIYGRMLLNNMNQRLRGGYTISGARYSKLRERLASQNGNLLARIDALESDLERAEKSRDEANRELGRLQNMIEVLERREAELEPMLTMHDEFQRHKRWRLFYGTKASKTKWIEFRSDGKVLIEPGESDENENTWRLNGLCLEFTNDQGNLHSIYNFIDGLFINDNRTLDEFIIPEDDVELQERTMRGIKDGTIHILRAFASQRSKRNRFVDIIPSDP